VEHPGRGLTEATGMTMAKAANKDPPIRAREQSPELKAFRRAQEQALKTAIERMVKAFDDSVDERIAHARRQQTATAREKWKLRLTERQKEIIDWVIEKHPLAKPARLHALANAALKSEQRAVSKSTVVRRRRALRRAGKVAR